MTGNINSFRLVVQLEEEKRILERDLFNQENLLAHYEAHHQRLIDDSNATLVEISRIPYEMVERALTYERHQLLTTELTRAHQDVENAKRILHQINEKILEINIRIREAAERLG